MKNFVKESGALIDHNQHIILLVAGEAGHVDFPEEIIWDIHKIAPGHLYALSHVHPPTMVNLSHEDETTLKAQSISFFPFPMRIIVIASEANLNYYHEACFLGVLESKESWIKRNREGERKFEIILEWEKSHPFTDYEWYGKILIKESYE